MVEPTSMERFQRERERLARRTLPPGDDGGHDGGMPPDELKNRLESLEKRIDADVRELRADVKSLIGAVNEVSGKVSQLPTTFRMAGWFVGVSLGLVSLVFTIARAMK